jgi:rhamnogalacturonyl hydrolase YesR
VHNTNLLAAELLARVFAQTGREEFREAALNAARFTVDRQRADGSWPYGEERSQQWIDSFHTGFVIVSLKRLIEHLGAYQWSGCLMRGFEFYRKAFFLADSAPKYYHNRLYPIDVHSAAQAVITFVEMADLIPAANEMSKRSLQWAIENLQDPTGFFYFQRHRFYTIRIPFMRWSQAWMLYALSLYMVRRPVAANV